MVTCNRVRWNRKRSTLPCPESPTTRRLDDEHIILVHRDFANVTVVFARTIGSFNPVLRGSPGLAACHAVWAIDAIVAKDSGGHGL